MFPGGPVPGLGPSPGASALDQPPPSPTPMGGGPAPGAGGPFSMRGLVPGGPGTIPAGQMPPEMLTGITQSAQTVSQVLDAWAQPTHDKPTLRILGSNELEPYFVKRETARAGCACLTR